MRATEGPVEVGGSVSTPSRRTATLDGEPLELARKEFDLLALLMQEAGPVVSRERLIDEVWDMNWFGSTKTLDVHVSALRKKLGDDAADSRYIHTVRGVGFRFAAPEEPVEPAAETACGVRLRAGDRLIVLEIPLVLSLSSRVNAEVKSQAAAQAQVVATAAAAQGGDAARLRRLVRQAGRDLGARVIVVDARGRLVADSAGTGLSLTSYRNRPEIAAALAGRSEQGTRHSDTLGSDLLYTAVPVLGGGAVRVTQSVDAVGAGAPERARRDRRRRSSRSRSVSRSPGWSPARSPGRCARLPARRGASRTASSTRGPTSRARASSVRSRSPSTT